MLKIKIENNNDKINTKMFMVNLLHDGTLNWDRS